MRRTFLSCLIAAVASIGVSAQTAAPPAQKPPPATAKPAAPRQAAAAGRPATVALLVTDPTGTPLPDTQVTATGPLDRGGTTGPDGTLRLQNIRPGNYRLRFVREGSNTLEREITVRPGEAASVDVSLTAAPPPPAPPEPVKVFTKELAPPGDPKVTPIPLFLEKNFIGGREGRKESALGCGATGTATLHQLREAWPSHTHDDADEWIYIVAGEGTLRIGTNEQKVQAGTFSAVPHSAAHALVPQGRNPLIFISTLSGPACTK